MRDPKPKRVWLPKIADFEFFEEHVSICIRTLSRYLIGNPVSTFNLLNQGKLLAVERDLSHLFRASLIVSQELIQ